MLRLTRAFPGAELVVDDICSDGTDILATILLTGDDDLPLQEVARTAAGYHAVRSMDTLVARSSYLRVHARYTADASIYRAVIDSALTPIGEVRIADDTEHWTLIADGSKIGAAIGHLEESADVDLRRVLDYEPDTQSAHDLVDEIRQEISARQTEYLLSALNEGYYRWPRDVSAKDLAERHDVSGPTALEHLRNGEATIVRTVLQEIRDRNRQGARPF